MDDNSTHARRYLAAGWNPLPLPAGEKYPPPAGTTGADGVDLDGLVIDSHQWTGNVGLRMPADVIGIDIDAYHGGLETLRNLTEKLTPLPHTYVSHSSRGDGSGIRFFRVPVGLAWVPGLPGIEIVQRNHRYAVVWPSLHPEGRHYYWLDQAEPDVIQGVPLVEDLAELPWPWIEELSRATGDDSDVTRAVTGATRIAFLAEHTQADAPGYVTEKIVGHFLERWRAGYSRHDTMQHCLTWAMECVRAGLCSGVWAVEQLGQAWQQALAGEPQRALLVDVGATEFEAMLRHAIGKVADRPEQEFHKLHDDIAGIRMQATEPPVLAGATIGDYQPEVAAFINWTDFVNRDSAPQTWLVEGLWPWGRAIALWANAKIGKSELALWCACKLALGEDPWTGDPLDPVDVAYFDYEMTPDDLDDRLNDFQIDPLRLEHLHYMQLPLLHPLDTETGGKEVEALVASCGAQAVVIDTLGRSVQGEEDKSDTVDAFYRHTGIRLKNMGVGYLRTDHSGKDPTKGPRGTSAKLGDVDVSWHQKRTSTGLILDCNGATRVGWVDPILKLERTFVNGVVGYATALRLGWPPGTSEKATELDTMGLPVSAGRDAVRAAFKAAGKPAGRNDVLTSALKYRRMPGYKAGTAAGTGPTGTAGTGDGDSTDSALEALLAMGDSDGDSDGTD